MMHKYSVCVRGASMFESSSILDLIYLSDDLWKVK